jgi:putative radical SAM-modified peptide
METQSDCIEVLDEGVEESLDNLNTCCKTGPTRLAI